MIRPFTPVSLAAVMCVAASAAPASAQLRVQPQAIAQVAALPQAELHGTVLDDHGEPLAGAVVSALGSTTAFAVSDSDGRFAFRTLPYGPYLVRAHLQGYLPARARLIQINRAFSTASTVVLTRRADGDQPAPVLAAGVGPAEVAAGPDGEAETHDHGEVAWRLRHLKRSVLRDAATGLIEAAGASGSFLDDSFGLGRAVVGSPARLATSLLAEVPWNGQFNLLTSTSFDRPQDLLSMQTWLPRGVAFLSLEAPTDSGHWAMRGAMTQGDLSSWLVAGSYQRAPVAHRYEAGLSYGMQRYLGGNADALAAVSEGDRNVGVIYAYDDWTLSPRLTVSYGAKYARHDYLAQQALLSPRASMTVTPSVNDTFKVRAAVSRRTAAPGAEEFIPPSSGPWLPPERTFSPVSSSHGFVPEQIDHVEIAAEREWAGHIVTGIRAFRQTVDDQIVTLFGVVLPGTAAASLGHYYVASAGDVDASGWGVSMSRTTAAGIRASIDYTNVRSTWVRRSPDAEALALVAVSVLRDSDERVHDLTTSVESTLPVTETRVFAVYRINSRFAEAGAAAAGTGARFDLQLNQSLPFLKFSGAQWEMLVAVRSLFHDERLDASIYDELLVVRSPKRVVGGVTVRF
jgi:carboxypeptidase family protein/TonB-dependent receptor-like protein